jgi:hypothetical protein
VTYRNTERRQVDAIRQRAEIAGFEMPKAVLAAISKEDGLRAALMKTREEAALLPTASDIVRQLRSEGGLPKDFVKTLAVLREKAATLKELDRLLSLAVEEQEEAVYTITSREADALIKERLQPRLAEIVAEARQYVEQYEGIPWGDFDRAMQLTDEDKKAAYLAVRAAAARFGGIKEAMRLLYDGRPYDLRHQIRNLREVWPNYQWKGPGNKRPWPDQPVEQLAWLVSHGAELWAPTPDEADEEELRQIGELTGRRRLVGPNVEVVRQ